MSRKAPPKSRGIVPRHLELPEAVLTKSVRQDPSTLKVSISDCVQNVSSGYEAAKRLVSRHFDPTAIGDHPSPLQETLSAIGFDASDVSYVRWAGARGSNDSIVAPLNVCVAFLLSLNTRGAAELRSSIATQFTRALAAKAGMTELAEAPTANPRLTAAVSAVVDVPPPLPVGQPVEDVASDPSDSPPRHSLAAGGHQVVTHNNTYTNGSPPQDTSYGLLTQHSLMDAQSALERYPREDPRYQLALTLIESATSIANSIAGQETARKRLVEAKAATEDAKKRRVETLAKIEACGSAADVLNNQGGGMNLAARRILRTTVLRCVDESIADTGAHANAVLAQVAGPATERKTALQHLVDKFQVKTPDIATIKQLREAVNAAYFGFYGASEMTYIDSDRVMEKVGNSRCMTARFPVEKLDALVAVFQRFA